MNFEIALQESPNVSSHTWDKLREAVLEMAVSTDEHVYKLAHVCATRANVSTDARMADVYKRTVRTWVESDRFTFGGDHH